MGVYTGKVTAVKMKDSFNTEDIKSILEPSQYREFPSVFLVWDKITWRNICPGDYIIKTHTGDIHVMKESVFESIFLLE